jgi:hypothetical protein
MSSIAANQSSEVSPAVGRVFDRKAVWAEGGASQEVGVVAPVVVVA